MIKKSLFLAIAIAVVSQSGAFAAPTSVLYNTDVVATTYFVATSQVGDKVTSGFIPETFLNLNLGQAVWGSGSWVPFTLEYDAGASMLYYTVNTGVPLTLSSSFSTTDDINSLYIRLGVSDEDAGIGGSSVSVRNISFDVEGTPNPITGATATSPVDIKVICINENDTDFGNGFKMTGQQQFIFNTSNTQLHDLYIDIFAGVVTVPSIPEPATMALLGLSVFGYFIRRKK